MIDEVVCSNGCDDGWFLCSTPWCTDIGHDVQCEVCGGSGWVEEGWTFSTAEYVVNPDVRGKQ